jgi:hypothetical protein
MCIFEKRVFGFEFVSGTCGFWISLKLGSFTSRQVPIKHKKFGVNRCSGG